MSENRFSLLIKGRKLGPFTADQITRMRSRGDCDSLTRIAPEGTEQWVDLDSWLRNRQNEELKPRPVVPPSIITSELTIESQGFFPQWPFHLISLLLLHFLTAGIHTFCWLLSRHGALPRFREDDPNTPAALGLCLVPLYQLYWFFFVFPRLSSRTNQFAASQQVPGHAPPVLGYLVAATFAFPLGMAMIGGGVLLWMQFSPAPTENAWTIFFLYPQVVTLVNLVLITPAWAVSIQLVLNDCYKRQIGSE